jgi:hypothetical protein
MTAEAKHLIELSDEELVSAADELFRGYDAEETASSSLALQSSPAAVSSPLLPKAAQDL